MKKKNHVFCTHCDDTGVLRDNKNTSICPFCVDSQRFVNAMNVAIQKCDVRGDEKMKSDLLAVNEFLPQYPVVAFMEAEARGMKPEFMDLLRTTFDVRPLG